MDIVQYIKNKEKQQFDPSDAINRYSQLSEEELMEELLKEGSVSNGKVTKQELDNIYNVASPFLTQEQRNKMTSIINTLKNS